MSRLRVALLSCVLLAAAPELVEACPVCFDSSDENRRAFLVTTALLTLLPLGMVTAAGVWLRARARRAEAEAARENADD